MKALRWVTLKQQYVFVPKNVKGVYLMHIHGVEIKVGFKSDTVVSSSVIDMYIKWGKLDNAHRVFEQPETIIKLVLPYGVSKTLIELGANVNAYCPGAHAGTPLYHATKRDLKQSVKLLHSLGANALVRNDDCQTPLDMARVKGHTNVVHAIENQVCYSSGWLRRVYCPRSLEALAPKLLSRISWVVVIPFGSINSIMALKMKFIIYHTLQDMPLCSVIAPWKTKIEKTIFQQKDLVPTMVDQSTKTWYKLASAQIVLKLDLDGLVGIGGEDFHTKTYLLVENFRGKKLITQSLLILVHWLFDRGKGLDYWVNGLVLPPFESPCNLKDGVEVVKKLKEELKAIQNNAVVQERVLELGALAKLIKMVKSSLSEESIQPLYVGYMMPQDITSNSSIDIRMHMKAMASDDRDLQEEALVATKNILQLKDG